MLTAPTRVYASALLDSARWNDFVFRPDDIVVCTYQKAGTTWVQNIVLHLIFQDLQIRSIPAFSLFVELRPRPVADLMATYAAQQHRRCIKSHVALDGIAFDSEASYIVVGRDPRDIAMRSGTSTAISPTCASAIRARALPRCRGRLTTSTTSGDPGSPAAPSPGRRRAIPSGRVSTTPRPGGRRGTGAMSTSCISTICWRTSRGGGSADGVSRHRL